MGSFANSAHVLHDDHERVAAAIREVMLNAGFAPADDAPDPDGWGTLGDVHATYVSEACHGWVSMLHSELLGLDALANALSGYFATWALTVSVNDSDWWQAMLFRDGDLIASFDTMAELSLLDELNEEFSTEVEALLEAGDAEAADAMIAEHAEEMRRQLDGLVPEDIKEMRERLENGNATEEEEQRYAEWAQTELPELGDRMTQVLSDFMPGLTGSRRRPAPNDEEEARAEEARVRQFVAHLKPILEPDIGEDYAVELLGSRRPLAEEDVRVLLEIIGILPAYADVSYANVNEFTDGQLAGAGIQFFDHLKFDPEGDAQQPDEPDLKLI